VTDSHAAPRVSVVVPTRNRSHALERALRSAFAQSVRDTEVVVVDDGSTDDTAALLRRLAKAEPRLRYVSSPSSEGAAAARNRGISLARGAWVAFLDDDDEWLPHKLQRQLATAAESPDAGVVYCPYLYRDGDRPLVPRNVWDPETPPGLPRMLFRRLVVAVPTVLVRRDLLVAEGGFDSALPILEEWDLFVRLGLRTPFAWVSEPLVVVNATEGSLSRRSDLYRTAAKYLIAKFERMEGVGREDLAHVHYNVGHYLAASGLRRAAIRSLARALWMHPWRWQRYPMTIAALVGGRIHQRAMAAVLSLEGRHAGGAR
jgi:glycosyltransferase involved in cell wall biosynthesis